MIGWVISGGLFAVFIALTIHGNWRHRVFVAELLAARRNPSCEEFLKAMGPEISADIALWAWGKIVLETGPEIAPWPDEVLDMDLRVDPEEFGWWVADFCKTHRINPQDLSDWPSDLQVTARALSRWLTVEQSRLA